MISYKEILKKYSVLFIVAFLIIFIPVSIKNLNIGFSGLYADGFNQHLLFMQDFVSNIKNWLFEGNEFSLYNFNIGYGADVIQSYGYYSIFDPFNIIAIILPIKWIEFSYYLILFLKLFLGGLFFCLFANRFNIKNKTVLIISGIFYSLGTCCLYSSLRHPIFASSFMYLPLVLLGIEKALRKESKIILITSVFLSIISQFYLAVYVLLGAEIYLMFRLCKDKISFKKWFIEMVKYNLYVLIGVLMGAMVLITQAYALSFNGRSNDNEMLIYSFKYYAGLISTFLFPTVNSSYTIGLGNFIGIFFILLFIFNIKEHKWLKKIIILEFIFMLIPIFGYAFSMFSYVNNRWSFILIASMVLAFTISLDNVAMYKKSDYLKALKILIYTILLCGLLGAMYLVSNFNLKTIYTLLLFVVVISVFALIAYLVNKINFEKINFKLDVKKVPLIFLSFQTLFIIIFNVFISTIVTDDYTYAKYYDNEFKSSQINDSSFYRVSKNSFVGNSFKMVNDSIYGNYSSTASFNTMNNGNVVEMLNYLGVHNANGNVGYQGLNNRYVLETLFGVKYFISKDSSENGIPYNFSYIDSYESIKYDEKIYDERYSKLNKNDTKENTHIYMNNDSLSLGYIYDSCISLKNIENINKIERQDILLENLIIDENICSNYISSYESNSVTTKDYELIYGDNIVVKDNSIIVKESEATITLKLINLSNEELYVEFVDLKEINQKKSNELIYASDKMKNIVEMDVIGTHLYVDNSTHLLNMGYYENTNEEEITITFKNKGEYTYSDLNVYTYKMDNVISKINKLQENQLQDIKIEENNVAAKINSSKDGMLFLSIPYNEGFEIYVNGVKKEIHQANIGFMAVEIEKGESDILIKYQTKYLKVGRVLSIIGISLFVLYLPVEIYLKKKNKKVEKNN